MDKKTIDNSFSSLPLRGAGGFSPPLGGGGLVGGAFIISGGGTGGHIYPAIAIADALRKRFPDARILFVGAEGRMEMEKVPEAGYSIVGLPVAGLQRKQWRKNFSLPFKLWKSLRKAAQVIREFRPDAVIGVGGYASAPVLWAAQRQKIPTLLQEQNSYAGLTNKLLAKRAAAICVAYDGMERFFPKEKIILTGNPVRNLPPAPSEGGGDHAGGKPPPAPSEGGGAPCGRNNANETTNNEQRIMNHRHPVETGRAPSLHARVGEGVPPAGAPPPSEGAGGRCVLVVGGSLGARTLNQAMIHALPKLVNGNVQFIWQTGKAYYEEAIAAVNNLPQEAQPPAPRRGREEALPFPPLGGEDGFFLPLRGAGGLLLLPFISRMEEAFAAADVVVSRAGAGTVSELCVAGKACVFVPSPNVAEDHQTKNAQALVAKDAALLVRDEEAKEKLLPTVLALLQDEARIKTLERNIAALAKPNAAEDIVDEIIRITMNKLNAETQRRRERYREKKTLRLRVSAFKLDKVK